MPAPALVLPPPAGTYSPIVITTGGTYSGSYSSVEIVTSQRVILDKAKFRGNDEDGLVHSLNVAVDLEMRNCVGTATNTTGDTRALVLDGGFKRLVMENNDFVDTAGCWFHSSSPTEMRIQRNRFHNITTRNAAGGDFVQALQFDKVWGGNVDIGWNEIYNQPGKSQCEDTINFFACGGTVDNLWRVHDNCILGAWPYPANSMDYSGGGIMHGDSDGCYIETFNNVILGTSNYGLSIVGGIGFNIHDNIVVGSGYLPDGTKLASSANGGPVGLAMWSNNGSGVPPKNCKMSNNKVGWWKPLRGASGSRNDWWLPNVGKDGNVATGNTSYPRSGALTYADEIKEYDAWRARAVSAGVTIGAGGATPTPTGPTGPTAPTGPTGPTAPTAPTGPTQADLDAANAKIATLTADLATANGKVRDLTSQLSTATQTIATEKARRASLITEIEGSIIRWR